MKNGFSLIKLIAVAIVGILAAVAIPSYMAYTHRANRTDATRTMTLDAQGLERCYSQNFTYFTCATPAAGTAASPQGYYNVTIAIPSASSFSRSRRRQSPHRSSRIRPARHLRSIAPEHRARPTAA